MNPTTLPKRCWTPIVLAKCKFLYQQSYIINWIFVYLDESGCQSVLDRYYYSNILNSHFNRSKILTSLRISLMSYVDLICLKTHTQVNRLQAKELTTLLQLNGEQTTHTKRGVIRV